MPSARHDQSSGTTHTGQRRGTCKTGKYPAVASHENQCCTGRLHQLAHHRPNRAQRPRQQSVMHSQAARLLQGVSSVESNNPQGLFCWPQKRSSMYRLRFLDFSFFSLCSSAAALAIIAHVSEPGARNLGLPAAGGWPGARSTWSPHTPPKYHHRRHLVGVGGLRPTALQLHLIEQLQGPHRPPALSALLLNAV